jgi:hypothetical protein
MPYKDKQKRRDHVNALRAAMSDEERLRRNQTNKLYRRLHPEKVRFGMIKNRYKLSFEGYNDLIVAQDNRCAVCSKKFTKTPHVDHDHACCPGETSCGKCIRGLLCGKCNTLLGLSGDSVEVLESAIEYLKG